MSVDHYENFPVASLLCPPQLRPPITAIYHFARTADDLADEGDAPSAQRHADLRAYRMDLESALAGRTPSPRWAPVFAALAREARQHALPAAPLHHLLDAFVQDIDNPRHADRTALLAYCSRSAHPVGRLLLHLYGISDARALAQSDAICSALQLINFWQDLSVDIPRGRHYLPARDLRAAGLDYGEVEAGDSPALRQVVAELCVWARQLMMEGEGLVHRLPGRAGWELRLVVQGGLRVLERIAAMDHATRSQRPTLGATDLPRLLWRALAMRRGAHHA